MSGNPNEKIEYAKELASISEAPDFAHKAERLVTKWKKNNAGMDAVKAILKFMEGNPEIDYGMPGPLVHFSEEFSEQGYEEELMESFKRNPTMITAWMVNRLINGTTNKAEIKKYRQELVKARKRSGVSKDTKEFIDMLLE